MKTTVLTSFKHREIDLASPVHVYRNLRGKWGQKYSLRQRGLVVAHADFLVLENVRFAVNAAGRRRVLVERRKNVHAFIIGHVIKSCETLLPLRIYYNPFEVETFMFKSVFGRFEPIFEARIVRLTLTGVTGI